MPFGTMFVYLLIDGFSHEVCGVFSSLEKAQDWLENKAVQENGWTRGEARHAQIEQWFVDDES